LAVISRVAVDLAGAITLAGVRQVLLNRPLEESFATLTRKHGVVEPRAFISTY